MILCVPRNKGSDEVQVVSLSQGLWHLNLVSAESYPCWPGRNTMSTSCWPDIFLGYIRQVCNGQAVRLMHGFSGKPTDSPSDAIYASHCHFLVLFLPKLRAWEHHPATPMEKREKTYQPWHLQSWRWMLNWSPSPASLGYLSVAWWLWQP